MITDEIKLIAEKLDEDFKKERPIVVAGLNGLRDKKNCQSIIKNLQEKNKKKVYRLCLFSDCGERYVYQLMTCYKKDFCRPMAFATKLFTINKEYGGE